MGWVVNATPRPLYPWERPGTHCIGGWSGQVQKISTPPGFDPQTVQPVASCYTELAILAPCVVGQVCINVSTYCYPEHEVEHSSKMLVTTYRLHSVINPEYNIKM